MRRHTVRDESGLTLVELTVYGLLLMVVLGVVGGIMISALAIEQNVRASTESTTTAQLAAESIVAGVRNGTAVQVTPVGDDQLVRTRTAGGNPGTLTWHCVGWYFSASSGTIRSIRTDSDATPIVTPTAEPTDWTVLTRGISASDASGDIFSIISGGLRIRFNADTGQSTTLPIDSSATTRAGELESASCFS